jgi:hypothetical protein
MTKFDLPNNFNGEQLVNEIEAKGITIDRSVLPLVDGNGEFWLPVAESDYDAVLDVIKKHKPVFYEPTITDKLAAAGISLDELKVALGI